MCIGGKYVCYKTLLGLPKLIEASIRCVPYLELNFWFVCAFISLVSKVRIVRSIIEFPQEGDKSRTDNPGGSLNHGKKVIYGLKSNRIIITCVLFCI